VGGVQVSEMPVSEIQLSGDSTGSAALRGFRLASAAPR
jgi:hypothetical protein